MTKISLKLTICLAVLFCLFSFEVQPSLAADLNEPCTFPNHSECTGTDCDEAPNWCFCSTATTTPTCRHTFWGGLTCLNNYECFSQSCISYSYSSGARQKCACRDNEDCDPETDDVCENQRCLPPNNRDPGVDCTTNAACASGECRGGICTCSTDAQCEPFTCQAGSCTETAAVSPITCICCLKPDGTGFIGEIHDAGANLSMCQIYCQREGFPGVSQWGAQTFECEDRTINETSVEWISPIGKKSPSQIIGSVIKTVLGIIGAIALLIFVYGGIMWMTSGGSPERIKKAQTTLIWAVIGLLVIFASYTLVDFVINALGA